MRNRDLIKELLDYNLDADITFVIGEEELDDFSIKERNYNLATSDIQIVIETNGQELIDKDELADLKIDAESVGDFKDKINELEEVVDNLESQIEE